MIKVLNLYAGIGGNRKYWKDVDVTAIEIEPEIAAIYQDFFPNDKVIIADAHQYLLDHYQEYDFIWSSPPCPTHSRIRKQISVPRGQAKPIYPDMKLYEEIIFLQGYCKSRWIIENVISFYEPLIKPQEIQRHYFWGNFYISPYKIENDNISSGKISFWEKKFGFNLSKFRQLNIEKKTILRNCVEPKLGLHIFNCAFDKFISIPGYYKQEELKI